MDFDTHWLHFEITHGPQAPGAKEDALFWYKKGQADTVDRETEKEDAEHEEEPTPADIDEAYNEGQAHVIGLVRDFANADAPEDPLSKENLLEFLETLK